MPWHTGVKGDRYVKKMAVSSALQRLREREHLVFVTGASIQKPPDDSRIGGQHEGGSAGGRLLRVGVWVRLRETVAIQVAAYGAWQVHVAAVR